MPQFVNFGGFGGFGNFFQPIQNAFQPFNNNVVQPLMQGVIHMFGMDDHDHSSPTKKPKFIDDGTESPQSTGKDELFPRDCGRDPDKGTGKLCFPDGQLCQDSKLFRCHVFPFSAFRTLKINLIKGLVFGVKLDSCFPIFILCIKSIVYPIMVGFGEGCSCCSYCRGTDLECFINLPRV